MSEQPVPISEIDDPDSIRVVLYQSGKMVHAPLGAVAPPSAADFVGPASSVADNIVTFADATGKLGKDSGVAVASLAPLASPTFTGTPAAPTAAPGTNTTQISTTAFVTAAIAALSTVYQAASAVLTALSGIGTAVAGDIIYATGAGTWGRLAKGTALQTLRMNAGATAPEWGTLPFVKSYESSQQTITSGGSLTLAHGLGVTPKLYLAVLQCTTAEKGYSIGDEVAALTIPVDSRGVSIVPDATNLNIRYGSFATAFELLNKTTGANEAATNANWALVARAWA
ncbi:hypothetical protein [Mesorhizobium sp.]|uniref:hypothetical protein n=1 Tax=Mesorhizobium sp. TaxID=1871066 RepID=UPI00257FC718|nr:hypothetical protein [Mesorhizobium sp.]